MVNRRQFIWAGAAVGGGLALGFTAPAVLELAGKLRSAPPLGQPGWIHIAPDGAIVIHSVATELGQGIWTAIAQCVCEEIDADWSRLRVAMAPGIRAYFSPMGYVTGGSSSTRSVFQNMRLLAGQARAMLIAAAAQRWNVPTTECSCSEGWVVHSQSQRRITFGSLAEDATRQAVPQTVSLKPRSSWRWIGRSIPRIEGITKIDGTALYGIDVQLPNMLVAAIAQAPLRVSSLISIDRAAASSEPGVRNIVVLDDTVAVVADNFWRAQTALEKAQVQWSRPSPGVSSETLRKQFIDAANSKLASIPAKPSQKIVSATYSVPLLMHTQLEPLNATARVDRLSAEVWVPTQWQSQMQTDVAKALGLWRHSVTVHSMLVGGGFGRRLSTDDGVTAALVAKELQAPVKCIWSREEDSAQARYRPLSAGALHAKLDGKGNILELLATLVGIGREPRTAVFDRLPYAIGKSQTDYIGRDEPVRVGSWRSVDASQNLFYLESFIDECAHSIGMNGLAYRQQLLAHDARAQRVLTSLARFAHLDEHCSTRAVGVAFSNGFESIAAQAIEVQRAPDGTLRVIHVYAVVDCGTAINPAMIQAQIEGGILFGLSAALREEAMIEDGVLKTSNFDSYPVLRMRETPEISVLVLETPDAPIGGIGEVSVPLVAPALTNAVFAATGVRIRHLPCNSSSELKWG